MVAQGSKVSFSMHGVGVSSGIAIGHAHIISNALVEVVHEVRTQMGTQDL